MQKPNSSKNREGKNPRVGEYEVLSAHHICTESFCVWYSRTFWDCTRCGGKRSSGTFATLTLASECSSCNFSYSLLLAMSGQQKSLKILSDKEKFEKPFSLSRVAFGNPRRQTKIKSFIGRIFKNPPDKQKFTAQSGLRPPITFAHWTKFNPPPHNRRESL